MKLLTQIKYPGINKDFSHKKKIYNNFTNKEINQYQIENFNKVWNYCYSKINFYSDLKKKFNLKDEIKNLEELDNFPRISKKDIIENFDQIQKDVKAKNFAFTGGTSGFVTKFPTGYINSKINYINTLLCRSWHNIHENDKMIYIWGHSHKFESNIFKKNLNTAKIFLKDIYQKRKRFSAYDLNEDILKQIQKQIFSGKFNTLLSYGSTLSIISNYINLNNMIYDNQINIIGTRHGEKLYETLCTREEMVKAEDMGDFYRIPADNRDLNYSMYFSEGEKNLAVIEDYHSHNTERLKVEGVKNLISKLPLVKKELFGEEVDDFLV